MGHCGGRAAEQRERREREKVEAEAGDGGARIADATAITEPLGDGPPLTFAGAVAITEPLGDVSPQTPQTARGLAMSDAQSFLSFSDAQQATGYWLFSC